MTDERTCALCKYLMYDRKINAEVCHNERCENFGKALSTSRRRWKMFRANWIPIEEMLPEEKKYVMVTCLDYHGDTYVWLAKRVESFDDERGWCWLFADGDTDTDYGTPVYAWMPLPKPFDGRDA